MNRFDHLLSKIFEHHVVWIYQLLPVVFCWYNDWFGMAKPKFNAMRPKQTKKFPFLMLTQPQTQQETGSDKSLHCNKCLQCCSIISKMFADGWSSKICYKGINTISIWKKRFKFADVKW